MAYEPERVVIELIAKNEGFDGNVKQSADTYETSMDRIERSGAKAEKGFVKGSSARSSAIQKESREISRASQIIGTQINDISGLLTGPKSPFTSVPKQAPVVTKAFTYIGAAAAGLGGILGGVLVSGAIAGVAALYELATQSKDTEGKLKDLVEKLKENAEKTRLSEIANDIFATTLEGVTAAIRDDQKALDKLNDSQKSAARLALENAEKRLIQLKGLRDETIATLEAARAQIELNRARANVAGNDPRITGSLNAESDKAEQRIKDAEARVGRIDKLITKQQGAVTAALSRRVVELVSATSDPLERIKKKYDDLIEQARQRAVKEGTVRTTLAAQTKELERQREVELEKERSKKRQAAEDERANRQSGRQITVADARRIVAGIGGTVTSGTRTAAHNKDVGGVANSFHVKGQAIDIAKTAGLTLGKIVQAFEKEGVKLIEKLDEGDHFHIAFARRSGPKGKDPQALADAAERREQAFDNQLASINSEVVDARQSLLTSAEEIAKLELDSIEISRAKYEDNVKSLLEQRKLEEGEAKQLLDLNEERAKLRTELVNRREDQRKFRLQEQQAQAATDIQTAELRNKADVLQAQLGLAKTVKERRDLERRLLDLQFEEERIVNEAIIKHAESLRLRTDIAESEKIEAEAAAKIAQMRLDSLPDRQAAAQQGSDNANLSPLDAYFSDISKQADDINSAFESIAAGGLATFTDALTDAIVNFTSLKDVARATLQSIVAGLVKLAIQQVILATIGKALGAGATAATATEAAAAATAWAPAAAAACLATLGANAGPAAAALAGTHALSFALAQAGRAAGFAKGGRIYGPGSSTGDNVPIWASPDEYMIKAKSARSIGYQDLEHINRTGKLPGFAEGGRVRAVAPMNMPAASPHRSAGFSKDDIGQLRSLVGDAVNAGLSAMPDVNLFASLDPADMLQRALGTPAGQKTLLAALGANRGRVKQTLQ
jgi:hypothetical protein